MTMLKRLLTVTTIFTSVTLGACSGEDLDLTLPSPPQPSVSPSSGPSPSPSPIATPSYSPSPSPTSIPSFSPTSIPSPGSTESPICSDRWEDFEIRGLEANDTIEAKWNSHTPRRMGNQRHEGLLFGWCGYPSEESPYPYLFEITDSNGYSCDVKREPFTTLVTCKKSPPYSPSPIPSDSPSPKICGDSWESIEISGLEGGDSIEAKWNSHTPQHFSNIKQDNVWFGWCSGDPEIPFMFEIIDSGDYHCDVHREYNKTTVTCLKNSDYDEDGVLSSMDHCPHSPLGSTVNIHGCSAGQLAGFCQLSGANSVFISGTHLEDVAAKHATTFSNIVGLASDSNGTLYLSDGSEPNKAIFTYSIDGGFNFLLPSSPHTKSLLVDANDELYITQDIGQINKTTSYLIDKENPAGNTTSLFFSYKGQRFHKINDIWIAPNADMYFTAACFDCPVSENAEQIFLLPFGSIEAQRLSDDLGRAHTLLGTADGKVLFVSDAHNEGRVYKYDIEVDGSLSNRSVFADYAAEDMLIDCENNIYLAFASTDQNFVSVKTINGEELEHISLVKKPSSLSFGGYDLELLFIAAEDSLYAIETRVRGLRQPFYH
ncbi:SMP-30/gluconolactonase/LRE family protein [Agaribacterium haliotis]|uniref:SMP-30/gluconolactonase/LRE family protein n=1 Tax=Agaribacterium haliotis TaxID=2013869 RepID=UPI00130419B8|nr:SMP-30/gluconolactonase/LRE family protein [Agaribacterium haliotis]